jgi:hypothetical protein
MLEAKSNVKSLEEFTFCKPSKSFKNKKELIKELYGEC